MNIADRHINNRAAAWTVGVHVVLLLLFIFVRYSSPAAQEPLQELGMEVNLGTDEDGSGDDQPMNTADPAATSVATTYKAASAPKPAAKEILRTEDRTAPSIAHTQKVKAREVATQQATSRNTERSTRQNNDNNTNQRPRYVYNGGNGTGGNAGPANIPGRGEGNGNGPGDKGIPGGTPGASNYTGTPGSGNGISHTLSRRSIIAFPPPEAEFREGGKVVIRITVNQNGVITNKQVVSASNGELRAIALRKLEKVKFNKSEEAPEEQFGNITFVFKTRS
ncbi:energy transducer TonB family protein [Polluticoccus soli]|uniref:energy transducer TonB family protein n=1 Tax=Polluticoccus soli TaxID=3034150 RepID=UPI0023E2C7E5|nr:energy transducer TonB [Flavipsychrobacter sp. JY13-12]